MQGSSSAVGTSTLADQSHNSTIKIVRKLVYWILGLFFLGFGFFAIIGGEQWWGVIFIINGILFFNSSTSLNEKSRKILDREITYLVLALFFCFLGIVIALTTEQTTKQWWGIICFIIMTIFSILAISLKEGSKANPVTKNFNKKISSLSFVNTNHLSDSPETYSFSSPLQKTNFKVEEERKEARILEAEQIKPEIKRVESAKEQLLKIDEMNGYEFEEYIKCIYESLGYSVAPTPLSRDQGADMILLKNGKKTAVQVKRYSGKVSNKAIQEVVASKDLYKCSEGLVVTNNYFTDYAIELANANNIYLVDRDELSKMIEYTQ